MRTPPCRLTLAKNLISCSCGDFSTRPLLTTASASHIVQKMFHGYLEFSAFYTFKALVTTALTGGYGLSVRENGQQYQAHR